MTILLGGDFGVVDEAKARGMQAGYAVIWIGKWNTIASDGTLPDLKGFMGACAQRGVTPYVNLYVLGGSISPTADFNPLFNYATAVGKTLGTTPAIVSPECEWNLSGIPQNPMTWDAAFAAAAGHVKQFAPNAKIMTCPGGWDSGFGGVGGTLRRFPQMMGVVDYAGCQHMRALPRSSVADYDGSPAVLLGNLQSIRTATSKPLLVPDLCLGSYGGVPAGVTYPWAGGNNTAEMGRQANAMNGILTNKDAMAALGVVAIFWRELVDNYSRNPSTNYFGWGESSFGLKLKDGTAKPAIDAYFKLGSPPGPAPAPAPVPTPTPTPPPSPSLAELQAEVATLKQKIASAQAALQ